MATDKTTKTVVLTFSSDVILIPPSASQVSTLGALIRATTLSVNGKAVSGKGNTLPTARLSIAQVTYLRTHPTEAVKGFKTGRWTLPVSDRGRRSSSRAVAPMTFLASLGKAPATPRKATTKRMRAERNAVAPITDQPTV